MRSRSGHSLIEMLIVVVIVVVLIALAVPAVQRSRESARQTQCISHQGDLAKAVQMYISNDAHGRYPGYRYQTPGDTDAPIIGWAAQVFDYMGRSELDAGDTPFLEVLVCPSDSQPRDGPRMNYVANGGQPDRDSPADGIFFDHTKSNKVYITNSDFRDGLVNTILIAENVDATDWNLTDEENQCILWPLTAGNEINQGTGPRPSSHHPGGFVAAFADGSVKFLAETELNTDPAVHTEGSIYTAYLTPGGDDVVTPRDVVGVDPCNPTEEPQLDKALNWITRHQFLDGHWSVAHSSHPDCLGMCSHDGGASNKPNAATALALLPLLGAGSTPSSGPYRDAVCRGIDYLMAAQNQATGSLEEDSTNIYGGTYSHLIANLTLAEALLLGAEAQQGGCSSSESGPDACNIDMDALRVAVQKATTYTEELQTPYDPNALPHQSKGGWRYHYQGGPWPGEPQPIGDLSHTIWAVVALKTAEKSGITVTPETLERIKIFLDDHGWDPVTDQGETIASRYSYSWASGYPSGSGAWAGPSERMTTLGLLAQVYLGTPPQHQAIKDFAATISPVTRSDTLYPAYMNMHATQLLYLLDGPDWERWSQQIQDLLIPAQHTSGHAEGSWDQTNPDASSNAANQGGRLYTTVMYSLCLETYFAGLKLGQR